MDTHEQNGVLVIPRRGCQKFDIGGTVFEVDLFIFTDAWAKLDATAPDGPDLSKYIDLLKKWGAPPDTSGMEAMAVLNKINELTAAEKKSTGPTPSSVTPTDSTPST